MEEGKEDTLRTVINVSSGLIQSVEIDDISAIINEKSEKLDILSTGFSLCSIRGLREFKKTK